eukprot:190747-Pleurochrysis_carterae.AAC.1
MSNLPETAGVMSATTLLVLLVSFCAASPSAADSSAVASPMQTRTSASGSAHGSLQASKKARSRRSGSPAVAHSRRPS